MAQPLNYQLSFGGEKIPEPAPVKKETIISGSTPDQIKLVSGIAQNWVTDYLKSENPDADVSSLGEIKYNPNLPVFDNAFPAINDQTDFKALGLEDENGKVTTKGEQYTELKDMGIITQFGGLSNHGKALLMSEDDALLPENIDIFRAREDIGMYKGEDVGVLKQIGDLSTELATGVQNIVVGAAQYGLGGLAQIGVLSDENKAADIAGGVAAIDAFTTGMAKLPMMSEGIVDSLVTLVATQMADSEDIAMVQAQHRQDVLRKASLQADYSFLEQISPIIDYVPQELSLPPVIGESVETAKQTMGEANYGEFTQPIQAVSQFSPMLLQGPLVTFGLAIQPEMLAMHAAQTGATKLWAAAAAPAARAAFRAGETAKIVRQLEVDASILNAQQSIAITKAEKASNLSASLSEKANTATFTGDVVGSKAAADVAARADALAKSSAAYAENIGGSLNNVNEQIARFQNAYGVADRTLKIADTFRKWPTVVGNVAGWPLEQLGKGLIATRKGVDAVSARTDKIGGMIRLADKVSGLGVGAVGSVFNPMLAVPAVAKVVGKGILALGPVIKGVGGFTRVMGEAASERAASIPFWQKVANFENLNPTQRMLANGFSEFAVAGGYLKRVGGNYAKTYPAFLGLEYLHSGDLETAAKNAIAPTIVIGAPGALLGSAITGSRSDLRNLAHQDMLNFRSRMPSEQRQKFDSMDSGVKKVIANVAESQPGVKFDFTDTGRGRFDENTYTVFINPNSRSPLRPVVTHEFLHYITEAGGATNSINHLLFGNEIGTGGLLKSVDGKYDKDYLKFKDEYIKLQEQDDAARRRNGQEVKAQTMDDAYMGMEYFVETQVDRLLRMSESGELSRLAGKTQLQRFASKKINELADSMMSRGAFLENLAMRMGSLRDNKGEYVMGNGILAEGVRDMPEMRNLFNKLISETSGRRPNATKSMDARSTSKSSQGREIPITDKNDPMIGSMYSDFVFDENNVVKRDEYGNPVRISKERKRSQESIGLSVADLQAKRIQSGEALLPGELRYDPQAKEWVGNYLTPEQIDVIRDSGFFEQPFFDSLELVNTAARRGEGEVVNLSYSAATTRNKKMGPSYFSGGVTLRQISPIEVRINKAGGIYVKSVDVLQLRANINEVARSKDGARVYDGDVVAIADDVNAVMRLHANDQPTDAYFAKYGAEAQTRKKLINSVFGKTLIDKGINEFSSSAPRSVIKDFRIDRFGKSVLKKGTDGVQVNHKFVRINYLPEGPLRSNAAGDVVVGNPKLKAKIEERNRKLGLPLSDGFADTTKPVEQTAPVIKSDEKLWDSPPQNITSADTSINDKKTAATFTKVNFEEGTINADIGGGRFDNATSILKNKGVTNIIFDPFNRTEAHNTDAANKIKDGQADTTTVNNVLNVIQEAGNRDKVIRQAANAVKPNGISYFLLYEGNGSGVGRETSKGWQENRKTKDYLSEIGIYYDDVKVRNGIIEARNPIKNNLPESASTRYLPETKIEDGFYSQLESVISKKIPTRATPEQIMATIDPTRGSGIKAEEIKWSGIEQALPKLAVDGKVTKEALLKYLADEGNVRFEEVTLGKSAKPKTSIESSTRLDDGSFDVVFTDGQQGNYETLAEAERDGLEGADGIQAVNDATLFSDRVLPGGENYREVVLAVPTREETLPQVEARMAKENGWTLPLTNDQQTQVAKAWREYTPASRNYTSSHFPDVPNYVAHMRLDERTLGDGTRTLHSAEYQSDRHQEGRKKGYALTPDEKSEIASLEAKAKKNGGIVKLNAEDKARWDELGAKFETPGVADAPFRTTWPLQLFKRQLRDAVEGGFDSVSWDVGETHRDRYDMSEHIETIDVQTAPNGDKEISLMPKGDASAIMIETNKDGEIFNSSENFVGKSLEEVIGKELANKVLQTKNDEISGNNLKVGGEGMKGFYDTMLPKEIGKYVKQWGGKVEKSEIGQSMKKDEIDFYDLDDATPEELAQLEAEGMIKGDAVPIWRVDITPEMRKISETGQTRYLPEASGKKFKPSKITARDIDEIAKEVGGGKLGKGSKRFGAFMRAMNDKKGGVSLRDVIKSYAITQSSIQRGEIANNSLRKSWPNHPFTEAKIRPEDAFAKLLQTKDGQDYLNSAEKGVYNKSAANGMIEKFKSFGLYNTLEKHLEQSVKQFYPKADELLSGIKDMPASEFIDYVQKNFKGISFGKTGFFLGNIGRGDIPTFDSRQSKLVYGEVVTNKKAVIMDQIDRLPKLGIEIPKEYEQYAQTLLHHEVWDRLNQSDTDHAPIKDTMLRYLPEGDRKVKIAEKSDENTEQGTPAPDSDVKDIPLTGNPIPWDRSVSKQTRFLPESNRAAFPTMSPKLLAQIESETSTLAGIHIDRMRVGEYMGVDLQGGMFYPTINENLENGVVWAFNSTSVARTVANRAAQNNGYVKLILMQEGNVVGNKTFANIWFNILSNSVDNNKISLQSALSELNKVRERVYSTLKNKNIKRNPWIQSHSSDWKSLKEAREALLSMPQIERGGTYFKKSKTTTVSEGDKISYQALLSQKMTKAGFPDTKEIVSNIEEPALKGIPTGAAVAIIKFDPLSANEKIMTAKEAGVTEHMSYGYVLKGKPIAKLSHYQVVGETFPKTEGQIMTQQHTDFEIRKSIPSKKQARGTIDYGSPTSKNKTLAGQIRKMKE